MTSDTPMREKVARALYREDKLVEMAVKRCPPDWLPAEFAFAGAVAVERNDTGDAASEPGTFAEDHTSSSDTPSDAEANVSA